jgi:hypothetical protein
MLAKLRLDRNLEADGLVDGNGMLALNMVLFLQDKGKNYNKPLFNLKLNDIVAAYITGHGYVGLGVVAGEAVRIKDFLYNGKSLSGLPYIKESLFGNADNEKSEFVVRIKWLQTVDKKDAYWEKNAGLFAYRVIESTLKERPFCF